MRRLRMYYFRPGVPSEPGSARFDSGAGTRQDDIRHPHATMIFATRGPTVFTELAAVLPASAHDERLAEIRENR
jgi:hypothetical protein